MQFTFTSEQDAFRDMLRRYFEDASPTTEVRRLMETETGWTRESWRDMNERLGLAGVHVPEEYGGQGFGLMELSLVLEEMGRALVCAPFFSSAVLATTAILNAADETQKAELLPPLVAGEEIATLAFTEPNGLWDASGVAATATPSGDGVRLNGTKSFVLDGAAADRLVVVTRAPGATGEAGLGFYTLRADAPGVTRHALKSMDPTRKLARIDFTDALAQPLGDQANAAQALARTLAWARVGLANEMMGGAERLRESALEYANLRMQFGRPIASFQSMKHKQADMLLDVELAKSASYVAAQSQDEADFDANAWLAKAAASEAYLQTAIHTIQIHGGIGFTWDNDTHLWFKRAKSSEVFLGDAAECRTRLMAAWGH